MAGARDTEKYVPVNVSINRKKEKEKDWNKMKSREIFLAPDLCLSVQIRLSDTGQENGYASMNGQAIKEEESDRRAAVLISLLSVCCRSGKHRYYADRRRRKYGVKDRLLFHE